MGNARTLGIKAWAATTAIAAGALFGATGCGDDGVTPVCTDVEPYDNRGLAGYGGDTINQTKAAVTEKCLTATQDKFPGSTAGTGGTAGTAGGGTGGSS
jgi:hypothetical protein